MYAIRSYYERFIDECGSRDVLAEAFFDNGGVIYMIADEKIRSYNFV